MNATIKDLRFCIVALAFGWLISTVVLFALITGNTQLIKKMASFQAEANRRLVEFGERPIEVKE